MFFLALYLAKLVDWLIHTFHLGSGSTWPGEIALKIDSRFVFHSLAGSPTKIILIAGTNGKTTTSLLVVEGLKKAGKSVIHNPEGANLLNGVASSLVRVSSLNGKIASEFAVFELDENVFSLVLSQIKKPYAVLLLNLFRDQLDRYGEVHAISTRWIKALSTLPKETRYSINGDDPRLAFIGKHLDTNIFYFGANMQDKQKKEIPHDVDSVYCPECGTKLEYSAMSYSHLGDYVCSKCKFSTPEKWTESIASLEHLSGVYNRYNIRAAVSLLHFALNLPYEQSRELLEGVTPAFGRQERFTASGKEWIVILSKNPSGFNQSIESLKELLGENKTTICLVLNDRIPDGTDVSWIWDVEFEKVFTYAETVITSGDRTYDMAIRMRTATDELKAESLKLKVEPDMKKALELCVKNHTIQAPIIVLATYTGMLEVRKLLIGKAML